MTGPLDRRYTYNEPTWYLSSMIFVMIPIFYLLCRNYNFTVKIFAPFVGLLVFGYRFNNETISFGQWHAYNGIVLYGVIRALGSILLGIICYECASSLKKIKFTKLSKWIFTTLEIIGWFCVVKFIFFSPENDETIYYILILIFVFLITLSASDITYTCILFQNQSLHILAPASFLLYLNHYTARNILHYSFAENSYWFNLVLFYALSALIALLCHCITKAISSLWRNCRHLFIAE